MREESLEVYSADGNYAVVRPPGRKFPGSVIQGDSLSILLSLSNRVRERARRHADDDLNELTGELVESLADRLRPYERVLREHHIELPYSPKIWEGV